MANPQKENGFTAIADELLEAIIAAPFGGGQARLLLYVIRQSYGFQRKTAVVSASDFARATGLHPKVVAREVRDLEARNVLIVLREEGKTSAYSLQKDYTRWRTGNVLVPGAEKVPGTTGNHSVPDRNQKVPGIYKEVKDNFKDSTEPHGSASIGTLRDRFERQYQEASNKVAVIGELFSLLLGRTPNHRRLGVMAKELNSGGKLMDLIIEASRQRISDDPHDYLAKMVSREKAGDHGRRGFVSQADHNSAKRGRLVT